MEAERWQRIQTLFEAALNRSSDELDGWLDEACSSQPELKNEVLSLLAADTEDRVGAIVHSRR